MKGPSYLRRATLADGVAVVANPNAFPSEVGSPLLKPGHSSGGMADSVIEALIIKTETIPFTFAEDQIGLGKVAEPLSAIARRRNVPAFGFWEVVAVASNDRTGGDYKAGVRADVGASPIPQGIVKAFHNPLLNFEFGQRGRGVPLVVMSHPFQCGRLQRADLNQAEGKPLILALGLFVLLDGQAHAGSFGSSKFLWQRSGPESEMAYLRPYWEGMPQRLMQNSSSKS